MSRKNRQAPITTGRQRNETKTIVSEPGKAHTTDTVGKATSTPNDPKHNSTVQPKTILHDIVNDRRAASEKRTNPYEKKYTPPATRRNNKFMIPSSSVLASDMPNGKHKIHKYTQLKESDKLFSKLGKYTKVALGFGATAWLVNKLSDTRGQQTNAQLYGQQQYY